MIFASQILLLLYGVVVLLLIRGWQKAFHHHVKMDQHQMPGVSVIVPFRNEEDNVVQLLNSLVAQQQVILEIILVNDASDDSSLDKIETWKRARGNRDSEVVVLTSQGIGKKQALAQGVERASHPIIITTDADCISGSLWASAMAQLFVNEKTQFVFGAVRMHSRDTCFLEMQRIEFASLIGSGVACWWYGYPTMCNGANLAFRKLAFKIVKGYEGNDQIASGDDEFLMRKMARSFPGSVVFNADTESVVTTAPQQDFSQLFHQRIRWAGKWKQQTSFSIVLALFIFMVNVAFVFLLVKIIVSPSPFFSVLLVIVKILAEYIFLKRISTFLKIRWHIFTFLALELLYPFYVVFFGIMANVSSFNWKGRSYKKL